MPNKEPGVPKTAVLVMGRAKFTRWAAIAAPYKEGVPGLRNPALCRLEEMPNHAPPWKSNAVSGAHSRGHRQSGLSGLEFTGDR
jgi:hypothetical protein